MNFFVLWKTPSGTTQLVTAPLTDGTILPGVTRQSILDLARQWGEFEVVERKFTMAEVVGEWALLPSVPPTASLASRRNQLRGTKKRCI